jgi:hypothetical protein
LTAQLCGLVSGPPFAFLGFCEFLGAPLQLPLGGLETGLRLGNPGLQLITLLPQTNRLSLGGLRGLRKTIDFSLALESCASAWAMAFCS